MMTSDLPFEKFLILRKWVLQGLVIVVIAHNSSGKVFVYCSCFSQLFLRQEEATRSERDNKVTSAFYTIKLVNAVAWRADCWTTHSTFQQQRCPMAVITATYQKCGSLKVGWPWIISGRESFDQLYKCGCIIIFHKIYRMTGTEDSVGSAQCSYKSSSVLSNKKSCSQTPTNYTPAPARKQRTAGIIVTKKFSGHERSACGRGFCLGW